MESYKDVLLKALEWELNTLKIRNPEAEERVQGLIKQIAAILDHNLCVGQ